MIVRAILLTTALILTSLPAAASTNTCCEGACKYIDAQGVLRFDDVCFITFGVLNSCFADSDEQPARYNAGAACFHLLFPNGTQVSVRELTWYRNADPVNEDLDPRDFTQGFVNRMPAIFAARRFALDQQGPATTVAITEEPERDLHLRRLW